MPLPLRRALPLILALFTVAPAAAQTVRVQTLVDRNTVIPGVPGPLAFGRSAFDGRFLVFHCWGANGDAIVSMDVDSGAFTLVADATQILPSQGVPVTRYASPGVGNGRYVFLGSTTHQYFQELCEGAPGASLATVFGPSSLTAETSFDGDHVTWTFGVGTPISLYRTTLGSLATIPLAVRNDPTPSGGNYWETWQHAAAAGHVVFTSYVVNAATSSMLFHYDPTAGAVCTLVDSTVAIPGDGRPFELTYGCDTDGADFLVRGGTRYPLFGGWHGIYRGRLAGGPLQTVVDQADLFPGSNENFRELGNVALGDGIVFFDAIGISENGALGCVPGGDPFWLLRTGDLVNGATINGAGVDRANAHGNRAVLSVTFPNFTNALVLAEVTALTLDGSLRRGNSATFTAQGVDPGALVFLGMSRAGLGAGPCPPSLGGLCLELLAPSLVAVAPAAADGRTTFTLQVPVQAPLGPIWFQAAVPQGASSVKTNALATEVSP